MQQVVNVAALKQPEFLRDFLFWQSLDTCQSLALVFNETKTRQVRETLGKKICNKKLSDLIHTAGPDHSVITACNESVLQIVNNVLCPFYSGNFVVEARTTSFELSIQRGLLKV